MTDRFELLEPVGRGGMGVVWKARDRETGKIVALKLLHDLFTDDPGYLLRFEREVEVARRVQSPNVVRVLGYGIQGGAPYMAMELVEGPSLRELIKAGGKLSWPEARPILAQVAAGIAAAHRVGVIHRDIKPSNVLIAPDGTAKLADFGIARAADLTRLTGSSTMVGTPHYMAPDADGSELSDLYAFGCVCYEVLAGHPPFEGDTQQHVILRHMQEMPDLTAIPTEARALVGQLLEKNRRDRPRSAALVAAALALPPPSKKAKPEQPLRALPKPRRTRRLLLGGAFLAFFLAAGAAGAAAYFLYRPDHHAAAAPLVMPAQEPAELEASLLALINDERTAQGLEPVRLQANLQSAGQRIAEAGVAAPCGTPPPPFAELVKEAPAALRTTPLEGFVTTCGTFSNAAETLANWLATPGTAAILLERQFDHVGLGVAPAPGSPGMFVVAAQFAVLPAAAVPVDFAPVTLPAFGGVSVVLTKVEIIDDAVTRLHFEVHNGSSISTPWYYDRGQEPRISADGKSWHTTDRFGHEGQPAETSRLSLRLQPGESAYSWVEFDWVPPPGSALRVGDVVQFPPVQLSGVPAAPKQDSGSANVSNVRLGAPRPDGTTPVLFDYTTTSKEPFIVLGTPLSNADGSCAQDPTAPLYVNGPFAPGAGKAEARIRSGGCPIDGIELRLIANNAVLARIRAQVAQPSPTATPQ